VRASDLTIELLPALVDMIVSEKRIQYYGKSNIVIDRDLSESYGAFAELNSKEFQRVLSNLINNAVEAIQLPGGRIVVTVKNYDSKKIITVRDNGVGIPPHILAQLGERGITFGKEGTESGSGLGVCHAKKTIESFGGKFAINSQQGVGTEIRIEFGSCELPSWFVPLLSLRPGQTVLALDDDISVIEVWKQRFLVLRGSGINLKTFTVEKDFIDFITTQRESMSKVLVLMDYELLGQKFNGLELIERFSLNNHAVLVTSRWDDEKIMAKVDELNVKLLPKAMAGLIPIEVLT
jgi:anti-sigma regulatory factor (Ser/Thr protein kinase)